MKDVFHEITLKDNVQPIRQQLYRMTKSDEEFTRKKINDLIALGVMRESNYPWASPVVIVSKKDGGRRFCCDFRKLNEHTVDQIFPIPNITKTIEDIGPAEYYSVIDFADGYWNIRLKPDCIPMTAIITPFGIYEWLVMIMGE